jgi:pimeloyl-ACP methyl ester carboxylesterase
MTDAQPSAGYFPCGLPYNRLGHGPRPLVVFQGLQFEKKPQTGPLFQIYKFLGEEYTVYIVLRKPGMPQGYTMQNMANDYAVMIKEEFGGPVDVIGLSTGGSIAQHFAADHPDLVRRLVIHSNAYVLSDETKKLQLGVGRLAEQRQWAKAYAVLTEPFFPNKGGLKYLFRPIVWLVSVLMVFLEKPKDPSDLVVTVEAEDKHDFKDRLAEIKAPTLIVAGDKDPFYPETLFRQTAEGIPYARLILYPGMGHSASGKQFDQMC